MYAAYHLSMLRPKFVADSFHLQHQPVWWRGPTWSKTRKLWKSPARQLYRTDILTTLRRGKDSWANDQKSCKERHVPAKRRCASVACGSLVLLASPSKSNDQGLLSCCLVGQPKSILYIYIYQFTDPCSLLEMAHFRKPSPGKIIITTPQVMWSCYMMLHTFMEENYKKLFAARYGDIGEMPTTFAQADSQILLIWKKWNEWCSSPLLGKQDAKCYHMNLVPGLHWNYHLPFGNTPQLDWKAFPKCYRWYLHGSSLEKHAACCRCKFASNKGSSHPSHIVRYVPITSNYIALYPTPTTSTRSPSYPHYLPIISPLMLLRVEQTKSQLALVEFPFVGCWTLNFATCSFKYVYIYITLCPSKK